MLPNLVNPLKRAILYKEGSFDEYPDSMIAPGQRSGEATFSVPKAVVTNLPV